ncbi:DUF262 domain-containing protein [Nitrosomonas sp. Nm34]|uniref:DUF262 domain-containing protein n=1 Tax=Nitrosomonas sp. Nm34 TaxID=1881055 RepID=UPI0008ECB31A|nr:DUF262 domain-containing protein [Nitrosomonas sp. Nm34]SFI36747.1 Protein of unknown function [Nitrosomonas sp. Nm34]
MQPTNVNVSTLFGNKIQFRIPLFQRHYVWGLEDQWQPLWEDIQEKSNQRLQQQKRGKFSHFTGAIVIQQKSTNVDEVPKYEIIDGQQRLTTFQIILCALREICASLEFKEISDEVNNYILNKGMLSKEYDGEQYKLIPTEFDRFSLKCIVEGSASDTLVGKKGQILSAYTYFRQMINIYATGDRNKLLSLFHAVLNDFGIVQILIDSDDEPEMIFESLNGRGKALLQFDLLRNNLFLRTRISEEDRDTLYQDYWSHFENNYWETEVMLGRKKEALSEHFFQHFLMAKLGTDSVTPLFKVYQRQYRKNLLGDQNSSSYELSELSRYSKVYKEIIDCNTESDIGLPMRFYKIFDITSLHPFILFLVNESKATKDEIALIFRILESYTIRRILCTTQGHKNYNKFFSDVIRKFNGNKICVNSFVEYLSDQNSDTAKWPDDRDVQSALNGNWSKIGVNKNVLRYILYRIELLSRDENRFTENNNLPFKQFTLEHILPQKWRENWQLPFSGSSISFNELFSEEYKKNDPLWELLPSKEGLVDPSYSEAYELALERDNLIQSIGNLTIVTGPLNSSLSNAHFLDKKESLFFNSTLMLSKEISKCENWNLTEIRERERNLVVKFCKIWPDARTFNQNFA